MSERGGIEKYIKQVKMVLLVSGSIDVI